MIELDRKRIGKIEDGKQPEEFGFIVPKDQLINNNNININSDNNNQPNVVTSFINFIGSNTQKFAGNLLGIHLLINSCEIFYARINLLRYYKNNI